MTSHLATQDNNRLTHRDAPEPFHLLRTVALQSRYNDTLEGDPRRISRAVEQLKENIDQPLKIENIAWSLGMSVSGFYQHFKSVTAMSPLQFQKQIRLQEAPRLMLGEALDVASASSRVGYEDPSYFSREYKKLFGAPPQRDIARLQQPRTLRRSDEMCDEV
jgi:AraC-like DNA-binding protein